MFRSLVALFAAFATLVSAPAVAQVLQPPFDTDYAIVNLGSVPSLPTPYGGLTFKAGDPNTILIGGAANTFSGKIYSIGVTRDAGQHVTGLTGTATLVSDAHGIGSGGIDGGLSYGPGGVLFYTSYSDNSLGQIKPGSAVADRQDALTLAPVSITSSVGALVFVPAGSPGAGRMKLVQYNSPGNWYDVTLGAHVNGTYPVASATLKATIGFGPEGVIYVNAGSPQIANDSVIVSEYSGGSVSVYEVDSKGDPVAASRRVFISALTGAEGAVIDPLTGDFLFSTFGGNNHVIVVRGFVAPTTTTTSTSTTAVPTTSTSSTAAPSSSSTSTSSTTSSSTSSSTVVVVTSSTSSSSSSSSPSSSSTTHAMTSSTSSSTLPSGDCAAIPVGASFASITCRLETLTEETRNQPALGALTDKLLETLGKAIERTADARDTCAASDAKKAKTRLKQVAKALSQYSHRLRGRSAKKHVDPSILNALASAADLIQGDAKQLKIAVHCPQDS